MHRSQGATTARAHLFADGGGRELAYVAMSRAREATHAWVVADDLAQAADDLRRDWSVRRTPTWALDLSLIHISVNGTGLNFNQTRQGHRPQNARHQCS